MNAVEIEEAISKLIEQEFDAAEFPFAFLESYGNKPPTIKRLRTGNTNKTDIDGAVLQTNNIHMLVCDEGTVADGLDRLRTSPRTEKNKAKFIFATDGKEIQAEDLKSGDTLACDFDDFPSHFLFFAALAGISFTKSIENPELDVRATGRLNRLYVELLKHNPDWATAERRHDMNQFMARMIFCFFAEDTDIFNGDDLFTSTIEQMSDSQSTNTHEVIAELFRAMDTKIADRPAGNFRPWADAFPYVNGGLFAGVRDAPKFSRIARTYLIHAGKLDWQKINPDIFGSMIQAVTDEEERGSLGMHYTSVENILKLLNPLFLDDLRDKLEKAGDNKAKLLNLRKRMAKIRVFDPACGSGNFLVIAYKQMREIEFEINKRRGETDQRSEIPLTNFRGIELRDFPAEIARLALIIAEFQCDVIYRGQKDALAEFLPLNAMNWITQGNALQIDWLSVCPSTGTTVKYQGDDLFSTPLDQAEIDFENEGGETFICGNPPYLGRNRQNSEQKSDTKEVFSKYQGSFGTLDYVAGWIIKSALYCTQTNAKAALVTTNSICQGEQVAKLWPLVYNLQQDIIFARTSFTWSNLASNKAGVTVIVVAIGPKSQKTKTLFDADSARSVDVIGPYLIAGNNVTVSKRETPLSSLPKMYLGNMAKDGGNLIMDSSEATSLIEKNPDTREFIRKFYGSEELIHSKPRACIWVEEACVEEAYGIPELDNIFTRVTEFRNSSSAASTRHHSKTPHRFVQLSAKSGERLFVIPRVSSENRPYLPVDYLKSGAVIGDKCYAIYDEELWNLSIIASKMHIVWIGTVCSRLRTDFSYGNKLGWNTFPVPKLTEKNKADLTKCAEDILLAREAHFPATIADLYNPDTMPENLRRAHERNDEVLERIYIGRRFKNDTERLEKLFDLYTKMTSSEAQISAKGA
ncbi:lactate dehydrogenase [Kiloniella litopenaei]|uniref:site-specific DNA-methyltransferase (adenine-specific) n=1 Tax=Kiloniella litopenaei TaxID=1549748 RepID=A0A0M2RC43_9PROT|nr:DNA methyltransferase [Kiloniella litopenaei]KKJ78004.1 lactate dehydrogenase [Kiloniella litopenaei]